jgi:hypothetical protein
MSWSTLFYASGVASTLQSPPEKETLTLERPTVYRWAKIRSFPSHLWPRRPTEAKGNDGLTGERAGSSLRLRSRPSPERREASRC